MLQLYRLVCMMSNMKQNISTTDPASARGRLLAAAEALFYEEGLNSVGIDRVIEKAGVAKASLYSIFGSKDALIRSYLETRQQARQDRVNARLSQVEGPEAKILAVFELLREIAAEPNYRGCAFARASNESKPDSSTRAVCNDARLWMRTLFTDLAREAGAPDPELLAQQLVLLYDGAVVSAHMDGNPGAADDARAMALRMLRLS